MIILASASPRRKELLGKITSNFKIIPSTCDETIPDNIKAIDVAEYLSAQKAKDIFKDNKDDVVIGSDTTIVFNNKVYGKAKDKNDARNMLKEFSGNTHYVVTGVTIISSKRSISFSSISEVTFFELSDKDIDDYLSIDEYVDKAGAYAIQGKGGLLIKEIKGDYNGIVGLPIARLSRLLTNFFNI